MKRRKFLKTSVKLLCACSAGTTIGIIQGCTSNGPNSPNEENGTELIIDLSNDEYTNLLNDGGSIIIGSNVIDPRGLILIRNNNNISAFANYCTHAGYGLNPFVDGVSVCTSGHGGRFNSSGEAISGPANSNLIEYQTELNENQLKIFRI